MLEKGVWLDSINGYRCNCEDFIYLSSQDLLPETDRKLAETYYNLGLAYSFEKRYDNALEHYQSALDVLEARVG